MSYPMPAAPPQKNALALTSMILGIIGVVLSFVPVIGMVSWVLGPLAVIFGIIGIRKQIGKGQALAGLITGGIAIVVCIVWTVMTVVTVQQVDQDLQQYSSCIENAQTPDELAAC
ncbi:DUF4190 domain-containing protein [Saccharopolyspora cebuensis]|uniref:DUF4190 domain-containing protein n=1 Tax=Saccharopolyspora cebuensis TaxID=418759 RepID=A0ABV4CDR3_9PSEU